MRIAANITALVVILLAQRWLARTPLDNTLSLAVPGAWITPPLALTLTAAAYRLPSRALFPAFLTTMFVLPWFAGNFLEGFGLFMATFAWVAWATRTSP